MIARADETHRVVRVDAVKDCQARECCPCSSAAPVAGDLHPLGCGTTPRLAQRFASRRVIGRQPEIRPLQPPRRPGHRPRVTACQIEPELRELAVHFAVTKSTSPHPSTAWQHEHTLGIAIPVLGHRSDATPAPARQPSYYGAVVLASVVTAAERPDLVAAMWAMPSSWPTFMLKDPVARLFYPRLVETFPQYQLLAVDAQNDVIGRINSVPFPWAGSDDELPARGWDAILEHAFLSRQLGVEPTAVSLIEARVAPIHQGAGLSVELLRAARSNVERCGLTDMFGPVRPIGKANEPRTSMTEYVARARTDGLPADPWLRVHTRMGARIVKVCPISMTVPGTLADGGRGPAFRSTAQPRLMFPEPSHRYTYRSNTITPSTSSRTSGCITT